MEPTGYILLEGGGEFGGQMAHPDRAAIALAGGLDAPIGIIPTAAAPVHNHHRAGGNGLRWFRSLGSQKVSIIPVVDAPSANRPDLAETVLQSRLIYLLGGFPGYLCQTLSGSLCWQAALDAFRAGAVIAGSSAGAMVLCENYYDPDSQQVHPGLGLFSNACVLPHHNTIGKRWAKPLTAQLPGVTLIGIDEQTGMLNDAPDGTWRVYGAGSVTIYANESVTTYPVGDAFTLHRSM